MLKPVMTPEEVADLNRRMYADRYKSPGPAGPAPEGYEWGIAKYPMDTSFYELVLVKDTKSGP